ncbi:conserved hypothetical protein [Luminiphilus syltensis NOR5-1B]|uniref:Uncharacterized protein n=2 Tax=Luminiphilus TaxID=1341118 RepID=B8KQJ2_9GAMM|nr:conserved hypothetical protein [Luminiphilus syltensis NOR5-1B]
MVVLAIVSILCAVALPAYQHYRLRGIETQGMTTLLSLATVQDRAKLSGGRYLSASELSQLRQLPASIADYYRLSVSLSDGAHRFLLMLEPTDAGQGLQTLSLDNIGRAAPVGVW